MTLLYDHYYFIFLRVSDKATRCSLRLTCKMFRNGIDKTNTIIDANPPEDIDISRRAFQVCSPRVLRMDLNKASAVSIDLGAAKIHGDYSQLARIQPLEYVAAGLLQIELSRY